MANNIIKAKKVYKWIRKQCEQLPAMTYVAFPKEFGVPEDLQFQRKKIEPFWFKTEEEFKVNHYRRAKRLYQKLGLSGVDYYFKLFGYELSSLKFEKE